MYIVKVESKWITHYHDSLVFFLRQFCCGHFLDSPSRKILYEFTYIYVCLKVCAYLCEYNPTPLSVFFYPN